MPFAEYVAMTRDMLKQVHANSTAADLRKIVDGNAPFELKPATGFLPGKQKPYKRGVLLTHGLAGSPYFMRHLANFFQENGFRVMAVMLPGHGTQPGDLLDMKWQEWVKTVAYGTDRLAEEVDEVYLAGYSIGGSLSVYQSLHDKRVRGLFLFAPAIKVSWRAAWAWLHELYSWLLPTAKWLLILPDRDQYKYESFTKNAAGQTRALTEELSAKLQRLQSQEPGLDIPVFAVASEDDATVNASATVKFMAEYMAHAPHASSKLVLYTTETDSSMYGIPAHKLELVNSAVPEQKILSSSHLAIVLPASDAHYGAAGEYSNCVHYYPHDMEKYHACIKHPETDFQGEINEKNLNVGVLRRLMYNPHFAALETSMQQFIKNLP